MREKVYLSNIEDYSNKLKENKKKYFKVAWIRATFFISSVLLFIFLYKSERLIAIFAALLLIVMFLIYVKISLRIKARIKLLKELVNINQKEYNACLGDFSFFDGGEEYINYDHSFSYDLDFFGRGSVFQFINRTCT